MYNYNKTDKNIWQGRIDSTDNYDSFRWHQWVEIVDLYDGIKDKKFDKGIGFIGFRSDKGVEKNLGRRGTDDGPVTIRKAMANLPCYFKKDLKIYDFGDINSKEITLEKGQEILKLAVERILRLGLFPIVLGGSHDISYGHYKGIYNFKKNKSEDPKIAIINFDAHLDMRPYPRGSSSGTMFRQIGDMLKHDCNDFRYLCLGVQKRGNTVDLFKTADNYGVEYIYAKDILSNDLWTTLEKIDNYTNKSKGIYMTICADVFSSNFAPGVSAAQPLGLEPEKVIKIIKYIFKTEKVLGFDIAEISPRFDQDYSTARLASTLIFAVVNTFAEINDLDIKGF